MRLLRGVALLMTFVAVASAGDTAVYKLAFWPGKNSTRDPRFVSMEDGPCGNVVWARVRALPLDEKGAALIPELAVELNSRGVTIRRWPMPVDAVAIGVKGNALLMKSDNLTFWVTPQGAITPYKVGAPLHKLELVSCGSSQEFHGSSYAGCWKVPDLVSGRYRYLSFQNPCT